MKIVRKKIYKFKSINNVIMFKIWSGFLLTSLALTKNKIFFLESSLCSFATPEINTYDYYSFKKDLSTFHFESNPMVGTVN